MMEVPRYQIVLVYPERFVYVEAFREIIEMLQAAFAALGMHVPVTTNQLPPDSRTTPILFGSHLMPARNEQLLPPHTILYNAEHLVAGNPHIPEHYYGLLSRFEVWDFNERNVHFIRTQLSNPRATCIPLAYSPVFTRVSPTQEDIDVLFYGIASERRQRVLDRLREAGINVQVLNGVYGAERDNHIARAKIVLNIHFYEDADYFESPRVIPLLANRKAVVCEECSAGLPVSLRDGMKIVPYSLLATACLELLESPDERENLASRGFRAITTTEPTSFENIARHLNITEELWPKSTGANCNVLIAGAGRRTAAGPAFVNADINPKREPDWIIDFGRPLHFGSNADLGRHGKVMLQPGMFDVIIAHHLLEHIPDLVTAMGNFLALLRDGGALHIEVPYDLSYGAWQDPTHVRAFNERSWSYFTEQHEYLDWESARFDLINLTFLLSPLGQQSRSQGRSDDEVLRIPRAVDSMRVVLVRRKIGQALPLSSDTMESSWPRLA